MRYSPFAIASTAALFAGAVTAAAGSNDSALDVTAWLRQIGPFTVGANSCKLDPALAVPANVTTAGWKPAGADFATDLGRGGNADALLNNCQLVRWWVTQQIAGALYGLACEQETARCCQKSLGRLVAPVKVDNTSAYQWTTCYENTGVYNVSTW